MASYDEEFKNYQQYIFATAGEETACAAGK